jgi:hypothetical protein
MGPLPHRRCSYEERWRIDSSCKELGQAALGGPVQPLQEKDGFCDGIIQTESDVITP